MPSKLETTLHRLNEVIALAQSGGHHMAVSLLQMAALELRLKVACITDEEFQALVDDFQKQAPLPNQKDSRPGKLAKTGS